MKRLQNTLYVTTQGSYLAKEGETVVVRIDRSPRLRVPVHTLSAVACFGRVACSPPMMSLCSKNNVTIAHFNRYGRFIARIQGPTSGNVLLRRNQYRMADDPAATAAIARAVLAGKIANSRGILLRACRDHEVADTDAVKLVIKRLAGQLEEILQGTDVDTLRGWEGDCARLYFSVMDHLITTQRDAFFFRKRSRRPPMDRFNALLSFVYAVVTNDVASALEGVGLDPAVGYLHRDRPGRPGLALDLVEELRAFLADRLVLSIVNRKQVKSSGFRITESGAVLMDDDTRKAVLTAYQKRKQQEITHPFLNEKMQVGLLPHVQAMLLARYIRGDLDEYPAFFWR